MNSITSAEIFQHIHLMKAVDVDPGHCGLVLETETFRNILCLSLMIIHVAIIDDRDLGLFQSLLVGQGQGRLRQIADFRTGIAIFQKA